MASGFNVVDFMDLPPVERCIVRLVLRETTMTYLELVSAVATLPDEQQMDRHTFDSALNHLTFNDWLVSQSYGLQTLYRVNTLQKSPTQRQGLLDGLDLEQLDEQQSPRLNLETADHPLTSNHGKRVLPTHIWDCLTESSADEPVSDAPKRRASLFDKFANDEGGSKK
jgi:hypothetical protein